MLLLGAPLISNQIYLSGKFSVKILENFKLLPTHPETELVTPIDLPILNQTKSIFLTHYFKNQTYNDDENITKSNYSDLETKLLLEFQNQKINRQLPCDYFIGKLRNQTQYGWTSQPIIILNQNEYNNEIGIKKINNWSQKYLVNNLLNRL